MNLSLFQKSIKNGEAFFITDFHNIHYFSGFTGSNGQLLITQKKAWLLTDFRYLLVAKKVLPKNITLINVQKSLGTSLLDLVTSNKITRVYYEEKNISMARFKSLRKIFPKMLKGCQSTAEKFRMVKTREEIKLITKAQRITEKVLEEVKKHLQVGKTEQQIAWEIERLGHECGADTISFPPIVGFGSNSASPHHQNTNRKLKKGDIILIDMGMQYKGYCSDMTRMVFTKPPTPYVEKIYNKVLEAQETAIKNIKPGMKGAEIDTISRNIISEAGYGETFGHSLGHGIGLEVHEAPYLSQGYDSNLPVNTVVTVEPGIYLENSFGVRIEDMILIMPEKVKNITLAPKKIKDCIVNL